MKTRSAIPKSPSSVFRPLGAGLVFLVVMSAWMLPASTALGCGPAGKPAPGVTVTWETGDVLAVGRVVSTEIRLSTRFPVENLRLSVRVPDGIEVLDPLPSYEGRPAPGEILSFPLRIRVPGRRSPALEARVEAWSGIGRYRVGAALDPTPPELRTLAARGGRRITAAEGDRVQFTAARLPDASPAPGSPAAAPETKAAGTGASPAATVTLEGRFRYRDRVIDNEGFIYDEYADNPLAPVRYADVELLEVNGSTETPLASGFTDVEGRFSFSVEAAGGETYRVRLTSSSVEWGGTQVLVKVSSSTPVLYGVETGEFQQPVSGTQVGDFVIEPEQGGEAFNILDACLTGAFTVQELEGSLPDERLNVFWNENSPVGTYFSRGQWSIYLLADEGYDDSVIIHEYGHYVAWLYSNDDSNGGPHFVEDSSQDVRLSWSEGWASYFQSAARARAGDPYPSWYVDTWGTAGSGQLYFSYDAELPTYAVRGSGSEVAVHALLWDIEDGPSTPDPYPGVDDDPLTLDRAETWQVMTGPLLTASDVSLEDFWDGWFAPSVNNGYRAGMETTFAALEAEYFDDAFEDDDTGAQAVAVPLDGTPQHHSFYPEGDQDYHRFDLQAGDDVTVETLNIVGFGDTYLEILAPDMTVVGSNSNRSSGLLSSLVAFTAPATGTYLAHVSREYAGLSAYTEYGSYDLRAMRGAARPVALAALGASSGVTNTGFGVGAAWADYDLDERPDLYLVNNSGAEGSFGPFSSTDVLYRNLGGGAFTNATAAAELGDPEGNVGAAWGDYDNDGDPDLFLTDHAFYRNLGNGKFQDVTAESGVADIGREFDAAWVDTDVDGLLDLFVLRRDGPSALWRNNGDGTFTDVAGVAGFGFPADGGEAYGCAWGDYDKDRRPDLFIAYQSDRGHVLYHNLGDNLFENVTEAAGVQSSTAASGGAWADVNNDGHLDLFVASTGANALYINRGDGTFVDEGPRYGVNDPALAFGAGFADYDLDGDMDLFVVNVAAPNLLYQNLGGAMLRVDQAADAGAGYGCAWGDFDGDGDPDLYVTRGCTSTGCLPNLLYRNGASEAAEPPSWIKVALEGKDSTRDGIGARILVHAGGLIQSRQVGTGAGWASKSLLPETFGIPAGATVDSVQVFWPSGYYNVAVHPGLGATLHLIEDTSTPVLPPTEAPPFAVTLRAPAPNPFTGATAVSFNLTEAAEVRVEVFDVAGRRLRVLADRRLEAGDHLVGWDGTDERGRSVATGIYFYRLTARDRTEVRKLVRIGG